MGKWRVETRVVPVDERIRQAVDRVLSSGVFYDGPETLAFGEALARYNGVRYGWPASSGTTAYWLILAALGLGPGDEIIVPANAFVSVAETPMHLGATVVGCDVREDTANLDADLVRPLVTDKTRVILVVHTYGQPVDMEPILSLARQHGIAVVEDCAHALGAEGGGRMAGASGDAAFFSFANKGISVCGQGGAAITDSGELFERVTALSRHGWGESQSAAMSQGESVVMGYNFRMSESEAAVGRLELARLDELNRVREANAREYQRLLAEREVPVSPLTLRPGVKHSWLHLVVRCKDRDGLQEHLRSKGIRTSIHYRHPVHTLPVFRAARLRAPNQAPVTERLAKEILTLPSGPWVTRTEISMVVEEMAEYYRARGKPTRA